MDIWSYATEPYGPPDEEAEAAAVSRRPMSETEKELRRQFPDPDSQAWITHCFGECVRAVEAQAAIDREDIRRAAEGRRVLG